MTRSELVNAFARRQGISRPTAERVVTVFFDAVRGALVEGDRVEVRGFGSFQPRHYASYQGRNPRSGAVVLVGAKVLPVFRVGKELRERLAGRGGHR